MTFETATSPTAGTAFADSAAPIDGRRQRSHSSRAKIVKALLDLVEGGTISPSAAEVAETAGVGLRSVFRHFDDMDSLYHEMSDGMAKVLPMMLKPLESTEWKGRIRELTERRVSVFEAILPFRISASIKRHQSDFLMQSYKRMLRVERQGATFKPHPVTGALVPDETAQVPQWSYINPRQAACPLRQGKEVHQSGGRYGLHRWRVALQRHHDAFHRTPL